MNFAPDFDLTTTATVRSGLGGRRPSRQHWQDIALTEEDQVEQPLPPVLPIRASSMALLASPHWINAADLRVGGAVARSVPNPRFTAELGIEATPSLHGSPAGSPLGFLTRESPPPTPESKNTTPSP